MQSSGAIDKTPSDQPEALMMFPDSMPQKQGKVNSQFVPRKFHATNIAEYHTPPNYNPKNDTRQELNKNSMVSSRISLSECCYSEYLWSFFYSSILSLHTKLNPYLSTIIGLKITIHQKYLTQSKAMLFC